VVGEEKNIAVHLATFDSRLLFDNPHNLNALATKNQGHFGSVKFFTLRSCLNIYLESSYVLITGGSPKSLYRRLRKPPPGRSNEKGNATLLKLASKVVWFV
jgi:hypothetical protein